MPWWFWFCMGACAGSLYACATFYIRARRG